MKWYEEIEIGMKLLIDGCSKNEESADCKRKCPLYQQCNAILSVLPEDWEVE